MSNCPNHWILLTVTTKNAELCCWNDFRVFITFVFQFIGDIWTHNSRLYLCGIWDSPFISHIIQNVHRTKLKL